MYGRSSRHAGLPSYATAYYITRYKRMLELWHKLVHYSSKGCEQHHPSPIAMLQWKG